jgi:hypothetical protein
MTENNAIKLEIENHASVIQSSKETANIHLRNCIENVNTQLETFLILEEEAHRRRLVSLAKDEAINPADVLTFSITP